MEFESNNNVGNETYKVNNYTLWGNDDWWYSAIGTYRTDEMLSQLAMIDPNGGCGSSRMCGAARYKTVMEGFDGMTDEAVNKLVGEGEKVGAVASVPKAVVADVVPVPKVPRFKKKAKRTAKKKVCKKVKDSGVRSNAGYPEGKFGYEYKDSRYSTRSYDDSRYDDYRYDEPEVMVVPVEVPVEVEVEVPAEVDYNGLGMYIMMGLVVGAFMIALALALRGTRLRR